MNRVVRLPTKSTISSREIMNAMGCSKQLLHYYRSSKNMPRPFNGIETRTDALANWLIAENCKIVWV